MEDTGTKLCTKCGALPRRAGKRNSWCKSCHADHARRQYVRNKHRINQRNKKWAGTQRGKCARALHNTHIYARKRGHHPCHASIEVVEAALESQQHCCAICGFSAKSQGNRSLCLDHCHVTGAFRGWLCWICNSYLARINENSQRLVAYLDA